MHTRLRVFIIGAFALTPNAVTSQGAPACPAPAIDTAGWLTITADSPSVSFALPPAYRRKFYAVTVGTPPPSQEWRRDPFVSFTIEERPGPDSLDQATVRRQEGTEDYSQCNEVLNGSRAVIQAQRGSGTYFNGRGERSKTFDVYATIERRPGIYVFIRATAIARVDQDELLRIVRTVHLR